MKDTKNENATLDEDELFRLGGKKSNFVITPAEVRYHHIKVEDLDKPVAAITYNNSTYSLFRASFDWSEVEKITNRLSAAYVITVIKKGWAIWVFEY
ncbi:hypothetical protein PseudUWO311_02565 [Pseudanabaena sp. UWO311]|uniref:hypothetical protein n=1 Tax=Pseudanabaena sp. UWO311 TaxID=2487337 RepID=UPI00115BE2EB|nr:hypothetical protein [Pseudanabaena sp. UWO311]TYQ29038.1 hypothetical protein PseudUWO311_02565 [Pseudanabaena sp. UWO311]